MTDLQLQHAAFDLWISTESADNCADLEKAKKYLPIVLDECCSVTQKEYIMAYYVERLKLREIAERYGVTTSTVSRTINRGLDVAYSYMRFVSPLFMKTPRRRKGRLR